MEERKLITALANKITRESLTGIGNTKVTDPEYRVLKDVVSDEMAEVALGAKVRKLMKVEEIAQNCEKSVEKTQEILNQLIDVGVITCKTENGVTRYMLPAWLPGVFEMMVNSTKYVDMYPEIARCFEEYSLKRVPLIVSNVSVGKGFVRVIPVEKAIETDSRAVSYDKISDYIENAYMISVADCSCRRTRRLMGEGCGHLEKDVCIQLNTTAESFVRAGRARQVTKEEAYEVLRRAEENGLIHEMPNIDGAGYTTSICNCCGCSCFSLRTGEYFNTYDHIRSNYTAKIDAEKCVACGQCVENCQVNAVRLGRKLCSKTPLPEPEIHESRLDTRWGKDKWKPNYRMERDYVDENGTAPCKVSCPAHIAVQGYIKLASQGKYQEALELIRKYNPMPAVCGRICNRRCESECTRGDVDQPIAIDDIKKFLAEQELDPQKRFIPPKINNYGKNIAIIGSGPAGLSCAYYLAVDGYNVTVFEKENKLGGMLTLGIPSFRLEKNVVEAEIDILKQMGVTFKTGVEVGKDITIKELRSKGFEGIYIAIGAQSGKSLGVDGENAQGVFTGIDFLRSVNLGKDVKLLGKVIVIGGGNVAVDVARMAARCGASSISMYCLEGQNEMTASEEELEEAHEEGITIFNGWGPVRILEENGKVKGVEFKRCLSVFDENQRFNPKYDEKDTITVESDYVLVTIGQSVVWGDLVNGLNVRINKNGTISTDSITYFTGERDIFAGGDVVSGPKFAIDAIAAGKEGAVSLHRSVWDGQSLVIGRMMQPYYQLDKENVLAENYDNTPRQKPDKLEDYTAQTLRDIRGTFTEEQVKKETARCLGCGASVIDEYRCVGCGICTTKCKFDAITLERRYDEYTVPLEKIITTNLAPNIVKRSIKIVTKNAKELVSKVKD